MAIPLELVLTVEDADGDRATSAVNIPTGFVLSDYTEFGRVFASAVDAIISGKFIGLDLCLTADLSGLNFNGSADPLSDVEEIASFQFATAEGRRVNLNIPGMSEGGGYGTTSDDLDQSDPVVATIIAMMENGLVVTGGTIQPTDVGEDDIVSTIYARERFRASGARG